MGHRGMRSVGTVGWAGIGLVDLGGLFQPGWLSDSRPTGDRCEAAADKARRAHHTVTHATRRVQLASQPHPARP